MTTEYCVAPSAQEIHKQTQLWKECTKLLEKLYEPSKSKKWT